MHIHFIETGFFSTDGGAMFGLLPKMIWNKYYPCDEQNRCNLSMRAILIEIEDRKILIDAGCGLSDDSRMGGYGFTNRIDPASAIAQIGIGKEEITDIILSHLHFDHCGGIFEEKSGKLQGIFPFATIHVSKDQLNHALRPSPLDEDAFFEEQIQEIKNASTLNLID